VIVEALLSALAAVVSWIGSIFPAITIPVEVSSAISSISGYAAGYWQLGHVLPVSEIAVAMGLLLASSVVAVGIKLVRIVASFVTAGGGSAA
jgi:hypothetical protein